MTVPLVRFGQDRFLDPSREGVPRHTFLNVYREMLVQICRDYPGLPDPRTLELHEIEFFYEALRGELKQHTDPKNKPKLPRAPGRR